ncbi:hypothetical protein PAAG_05094 [Paracoccidioides lutzii Pb01]|uniref:Uncharacterized protein n=1 Tax=Paracoccidioides lutzii (strain ATCC MYA-826 / Pb01) TaxID=502779 RepID=C1H2V1_PARBA|nr:hypothetical protein PAAG_05094 [Paracoccidioides lutzii Pb01]EEH34045.1 hypothetical protein PAAG_05094 [Paracoccidioides lutzii Pb01]
MTKTLSPETISAHINRIISRWPIDHVRPSSVSIQTYLKTRIPTTAPAISPSHPQTQQHQQLSASGINALYSLLENRYDRLYPLPQNLRYPRSSPSHYDDVLREFKEAPERGWLKRVVKKVKGAFRFR